MRRDVCAGKILALLLSVACVAAGCSGGGSSALPGPGGRSPSPTPAPSTSPTPSPGGEPNVDGCQIFPDGDPWNTDISGYPVDPHSADYLANMDPSGYLHPDFGSNPSYGIPWTTVPGSQPLLPISFQVAAESNPGPYPYPTDVPIEAGSDHHAIVIDTGSCMLYETYDTTYLGPPASNGFSAYSGAVFNLAVENPQRTDGWTSADAAGLAIFPGLVRKSEADAGVINHAFRFTMSQTQAAFIHPAQHCTSGYPVGQYPYYPPMGLRVRLKASYDLSGFTGDALAILTAMKKYGMILADNGSSWYFTGETNTSWDDDDLDQIKSVPASAFEVVSTGTVITGYC